MKYLSRSRCFGDSNIRVTSLTVRHTRTQHSTVERKYKVRFRIIVICSEETTWIEDGVCKVFHLMKWLQLVLVHIIKKSQIKSSLGVCKHCSSRV